MVIYNNPIRDISILENWTLKDLNIGNTNVIDFRPIGTMKLDNLSVVSPLMKFPKVLRTGNEVRFANTVYDSEGNLIIPKNIEGGRYDSATNEIILENVTDDGTRKLEYSSSIKYTTIGGSKRQAVSTLKGNIEIASDISPIINGIHSTYAKQGEKFDNLKGVRAIDKDGYDIDIISVTGNLNVDEIGDYTLTYTTSDIYGNTKSEDREIKVRPMVKGTSAKGDVENILIETKINNNPKSGITFKIKDDLVMGKNDIFYIGDFIEVDAPIDITKSISQCVSTTKAGFYRVEVKYTNNINKEYSTIDFTVEVKDSSRPKININHISSVEPTVGKEYTREMALRGVYIEDEEDNLKDNIEIIGLEDVNITDDNAYSEIKYVVTDSHGLKSTYNRNITTKHPPKIGRAEDIVVEQYSIVDLYDIDLDDSIWDRGSVGIEGKLDTSILGEHIIKYIVDDGRGRVTELERKITVVPKSNEKPVIHGANDITIKVGDTFNSLDGVTATDKEDVSITNIEVTGKVNTSEVGEYTLTYKVTDSDNNVTTVERVVTVRTNEKPVIHGADDITIKVGDKFNPLDGVSATDKEDITISNIEVTGKVNTSEVGEYTLIYKVTDTDNNVTTVERTVTVRSNEKPVIHGADDITIKVGDKFNLLDGVTATDTEDGTISNIEVIGNIDTNRVGTYTLTYKVTDNDGNITTVERIVIVKSNSKPITPPNTHPNIESTKPTEFEEIVGLNRFETATKISSKWNSAENVVITNAYSIVDSLSATPFASSKDAPILLSDKDNLTDITKNELKRLKTKNVYLIGGYSVLNDNIEKELKNIGINVVRIAGKTRFETSIEIAKYMTKDKKVSNIVIANGIRGLADAVTISPVASEKNMPIILSDIDKLPSGLDFIKEKNIDKTYIIGGTHNISENLSKEIDNITGDVVRVYGEDRDKTNIKVIETFYDTDKLNNIFVSKNGITKDIDLIDSLAVGSLASKEKSPILLVGNKLKEYQKNFIKKVKALKITKVGGNGNENAMNEIKDIVNSK